MKKRTTPSHTIRKGMLGLAAVAGLCLVTSAAIADDPTSMAPPIQSNAPLSSGSNAGANASADTVFNWQEIPANQQVPLTRATFDQGGYQLYDTSGETVIVPFSGQNLYVMKFAQSKSGKLYFENTGAYPILYVPKGGFLENATVAGARWYPFGQEFHPEEPVFLGIAPSYDEFINMGWYPEMNCYGGYYGPTSFIAGGVFLPTVGLFFEIGGRPYYGWHGYHDYYDGHPDCYRTDYYNRDYYHFVSHPYNGYARSFNGAGRPFYAHRTFGASNGFGGRPSYNVRENVNVHQSDNARQDFGSVRTFRGGTDSSQGGRYSGGSQNYSGRTSQGSSFGQSARSYGGSQRGSSRGGSSFGQSTRSYSSGSTRSNSGGGGRTFSGGGSHIESGGGSSRGGFSSGRR